eukprot:403338353
MNLYLPVVLIPHSSSKALHLLQLESNQLRQQQLIGQRTIDFDCFCERSELNIHAPEFKPRSRQNSHTFLNQMPSNPYSSSQVNCCKTTTLPCDLQQEDSYIMCLNGFETQQQISSILGSVQHLNQSNVESLMQQFSDQTFLQDSNNTLSNSSNNLSYKESCQVVNEYLAKINEYYLNDEIHLLSQQAIHPFQSFPVIVNYPPQVHESEFTRSTQIQQYNPSTVQLNNQKYNPSTLIPEQQKAQGPLSRNKKSKRKNKKRENLQSAVNLQQESNQIKDNDLKAQFLQVIDRRIQRLQDQCF